jgi:hypothetical protein
MSANLCPVCAAPSDGWPLDLCQDHWEAYTSSTFFESKGGLLTLPRGFDDRWIAAARDQEKVIWKKWDGLLRRLAK